MVAKVGAGVTVLFAAKAAPSALVKAHKQPGESPVCGRGQSIGPYDVLIAGQVLARGRVLVTHNVDEFARVPGLAVDDWQA